MKYGIVISGFVHIGRHVVTVYEICGYEIKLHNLWYIPVTDSFGFNDFLQVPRAVRKYYDGSLMNSGKIAEMENMGIVDIVSVEDAIRKYNKLKDSIASMKYLNCCDPKVKKEMISSARAKLKVWRKDIFDHKFED